jgi:hypothetical protein
MKKIVFYIGLSLMLAGLTSCAASKQKANAVAQDTSLTYANSWQLQSYPQVHERPPIN